MPPFPQSQSQPGGGGNLWTGGAAAPVGAPGSSSNGPFQPQRGRVISISRQEIFGSTHTLMKVQLDKPGAIAGSGGGAERTIRADGHAGAVRIGMDIVEGDMVRLAQAGPSQVEWTKVHVTAESTRKKRRVLDASVLLGPTGLPKLYHQFPLIHWETRPNYETRTLSQLVRMYREWAFQLWPKDSFDLVVDKLEKLGSKAQIREALNTMRHGEEPEFQTLATIALAKKGALTEEQMEAMKANANQHLSDNAKEMMEAFQEELRRKREAAQRRKDGLPPLDEKPASGSAAGSKSRMDEDEGLDDEAMATLWDRANANRTGTTIAKATSSARQDDEAEMAARLERELMDNDEEIDLYGKASSMFEAPASQKAHAGASTADGGDNSRHMHGGMKRRRVIDEEEEEDEAEFDFATRPSLLDAVDEPNDTETNGAAAADPAASSPAPGSPRHSTDEQQHQTAAQPATPSPGRPVAQIDESEAQAAVMNTDASLSATEERVGASIEGEASMLPRNTLDEGFDEPSLSLAPLPIMHDDDPTQQHQTETEMLMADFFDSGAPESDPMPAVEAEGDGTIVPATITALDPAAAEQPPPSSPPPVPSSTNEVESCSLSLELPAIDPTETSSGEKSQQQETASAGTDPVNTESNATATPTPVETLPADTADNTFMDDDDDEEEGRPSLLDEVEA